MKRFWLGSSMLILGACGPEADDSAEPGFEIREGACEILSDDALAWEGEVGWAFDVAVGPAGDAHVVWSVDGVLRASVRGSDGAWREVTGALADADVASDIDLAAGDVGEPTLLLRNNHYDTTTAWRWTGSEWGVVLETQSDHGSNQGRAPLAVGGDGVAYFSLIQDPLGADDLELFQTPPEATRASSLGPLELDGSDPLIGADERGDVHIMYAGYDNDQRSLNYRAPDGTEVTVLEDHSSWPDFAVARNGLYAVADVDDELTLLASRTGRTWVQHPIGEPQVDHCPQYDEYSHADEAHEGEVCNHLSVAYTRATLVGGPTALLVVEEIHEEGPKTWRCNYGHGGSCGWSRNDDFEELHRLLIGTVGVDGVELHPLPIELRDSVDYAWSFRAAQAAEGRIHLVLNEVHNNPDGTLPRLPDLHHIELNCN